MVVAIGSYCLRIKSSVLQDEKSSRYRKQHNVSVLTTTIHLKPDTINLGLDTGERAQLLGKHYYAHLFYHILKTKYLTCSLGRTTGSLCISQLTADNNERNLTLILDHTGLSNKIHCAHQYRSVHWNTRVSGRNISWIPRLRDALKFLFPQRGTFFLLPQSLSWTLQKGDWSIYPDARILSVSDYIGCRDKLMQNPWLPLHGPKSYPFTLPHYPNP